MAHSGTESPWRGCSGSGEGRHRAGRRGGRGERGCVAEPADGSRGGGGVAREKTERRRREVAAVAANGALICRNPPNLNLHY
jgi:hypothetical protein